MNRDTGDRHRFLSGEIDRYGYRFGCQLRLEPGTNLNQIVAGPTPYQGEEVSILAGLYAAPGQDWAKALIDLLSVILTFNPTIQVADTLATAVMMGVTNMLGLNEVNLHLGVRDTFNPASRPFYRRLSNQQSR